MVIFTLEEARALLPQVREVTDYYHDLVEDLWEQMENLEEQVDLRRHEQRINVELQKWQAELNDFGVEAKGLWVADFDSGDGYYYCWQLGEEDIEHFHLYDTGFNGRRPITLLT